MNGNDVKTPPPHLPQNDEPTLNDKLERSKFISKMADVIRNCTPPQVFGLHGDWGAGKTSAMHQLYSQLAGVCPPNNEDQRHLTPETDPDTEVVWFEAWRYEHESAPVVALIQEIRTHLSLKAKLVDEAGKLLHVITRSLMDFDLITGMLGGAKTENIHKHGEKWEQDRLRVVLPAQLIRQQLEQAISDLLRKPDRRLVILIDDLDRCEPRAAYKLLEGIKIYLNLKNCVFVLGMNQRVIEQAVAENLKTEKTAEGADSVLATFRAREYLEKICQELWHLPAITKPHEYLYKSLAGYDRAEQLAKVAEETTCLPPNPRKIKTIANVLRRLSQVPDQSASSSSNPQPGDYCRLLVACLYCLHPDIYRRIELYPEFFEFVKNWAAGRQTGEQVGASHELVAGLKLPDAVTESSSGPTPGSSRQLVYIDPVRTNAFLLGKLIQSAAVSQDTIRPYFFS